MIHVEIRSIRRRLTGVVHDCEEGNQSEVVLMSFDLEALCVNAK